MGTGTYDIIQCEQYKCESQIYGRDDVYVDKESGNIYMVEFCSKDLKFLVHLHFSCKLQACLRLLENSISL